MSAIDDTSRGPYAPYLAPVEDQGNHGHLAQTQQDSHYWHHAHQYGDRPHDHNGNGDLAHSEAGTEPRDHDYETE